MESLNFGADLASYFNFVDNSAELQKDQLTCSKSPNEFEANLG